MTPQIVGYWCAVALAAFAAACDRPAAEQRSPAADAGAGPLRGIRGAVLTTPKPKPDFTLTTTDGRRFDFRRETDGALTLLFFGYTHCPDVCPVHIANLAAVMKRLPWEVASRIKVVFVTTDPARDTPERLRRWLGNFDPSFIGLTGTEEELRQAQLAAGIMPAQRDTAGTDDDYTVGHAAFVIAYTPDNLARVMYPFGVRQSDWAHDLPKLVTMGPQIEIRDAYVLAAPGAGVVAAYFTIHNPGDSAVTLTGVSTDVARSAVLHRTRRGGNRLFMEEAGRVVIPAGQSLTLRPGGLHLMLSDLARPLAVGDTVHLRLDFEGLGDQGVAAVVRPYGAE